MPWLLVALAAACQSSSSDSGTTDPNNPTEPGPGGGGQNPPGQGGGPSEPGKPGEPGEGEPPPIPYQKFDINHVVSTGQSNSVAHEGRPVLSTAQPYGNLMFDVGVMTSGVCEAQGCRTYQAPGGFVPLVEGDTFWYPVETMSSGLANQATKIALEKHKEANHTLLVSLAGRNGLTYWCLRKGGCNFIEGGYLIAFDESMRQVRDAKAIAAAQGKTYVVRVATSIHGESDDYAYATNTQEFPLDGTDGKPGELKSYTDGLLEWQRDYEAGIKEITGQTLGVPLLISQFSGWNDISRSAVTQMQYEAHASSNGKVVIVTPGYPLEWHEDCRHYSNHGERHLGEYFAKAYNRIVLEGRRWEPVRPRQVTVAGTEIVVKYHVPVPPLVLDTTRVVDPGNYGFEVVDAAGANIPIFGVSVLGTDSVKITLATPPPKGAHVRYAFATIPHSCPGKTDGARGNLRDSDNTPSQNGYELFNWGVHYDVPVP